LLVSFGLTTLFVAVTALPARADASASVVADPPGNAPARPVFLVTDVTVGDGVPVERDVARNVLATRFGRWKNVLEVRSFSEVRATLDAAAAAQLLGGATDEELARMANYVAVDRLVLGSIAAVGGVVDLQVKLFNAREGVTEVAFARRLGRDADWAMVLALLDTLADNLLAWTIEHYTEGAPSVAASALKARKLGGRKAAVVAPTVASPWGTSGVVGAGAAGLGAGVLGLGLFQAFADGDASPADIGFVAAGGAALVLGASAVAVDLGDGAGSE
jgi:hypothetical protein